MLKDRALPAFFFPMPEAFSLLAPDLPRAGVATETLRELVPPLPVPRPTRLLVLGVGIKAHFPWEVTRRRYGLAVERVRAALDPAQFEVLCAGEPFEDPDALLPFCNGLLAGGLAGVVLFHSSYTAGEIGSQFGLWLKDHHLPVLSWSFPDRPVSSGGMEANSLCCQNFLLNMFGALGLRYAWLHADVEGDLPPTVARFARTVRARERFRHGRVLHVGGSRVTAFYDGEVDELSVMKRFGLRFDRLVHEEAFQFARKYPEADVRRLHSSIVKSPECARDDVPAEQALQTLRLGLACWEMAATRGYVGCIIKSWPELFGCYGCAADGAVSMLNDAGLCTAEEGEMNGLLSSLSLHLLSEGRAVPTMMDLSVARPGDNRLGLWHCGASPTRLLKRGTKFEARKHMVLEGADPGTAVGLMMEFLLELGPVTVVRYMAPRADRMFAFEGDLRDCPPLFRGNYGELEPGGPAGASGILRTILGLGLDHHWSLGYGHWHDDLRMLNHWLGVEDIPVQAAGPLHGLSG